MFPARTRRVTLVASSEEYRRLARRALEAAAHSTDRDSRRAYEQLAARLTVLAQEAERRGARETQRGGARSPPPGSHPPHEKPTIERTQRR